MPSKSRRPIATEKTKRAPSGGQPAGRVRVRMYRQGLGDCFLVSFFVANPPVHMLIDCGTLGATTTGVKMPDVVQNIRETTGKHLNILVGTHEHRDHVSGFGGNPSPFDDFTVDHSWVAWTEDPSDHLAAQIAKYKGDLVEGIRLAVNALQTTSTKYAEEREALDQVRSGMRELLGFFAPLPADNQPLAAGLAKGVNEAMSYIRTKGTETHFFSPGTVSEYAWLPGVRFYILGPPRDESALRNMGEHGSAELYGVAAQLSHDLAVWSQFAISGKSFPAHRDSLTASERQELEAQLPFDPQFRLEATNAKQCKGLYPQYFAKKEAWRRIDSDWLVGGSELALQLDSYTNNTSLAIAIELIDDGSVLLFPADAQVGNWLSWHDQTWKVKEGGTTREVKAEDLLSKTVFYKVGHHSSHNATVKAKGLEMMRSEDLLAMIPVDRKVALKKTPPWLMPAEALYKRLLIKTKGRVLRSDLGWPTSKECAAAGIINWQQIRNAAPITVSNPTLYIDYILK